MEDVISWALDIKGSTQAQDILSDHQDAEIMWAKTLRVATDGARRNDFKCSDDPRPED
jgi:hypothetical protein